MFTRVVALLGIVAAAGIVLGIVGLMSPGTVDATQHSASRSFSADPVAPGDEVVVTITASGFGFGGRIVETLPQGFGYVSSPHPSADHDPSGRTVSYTILGGESTFEYTVTASDTDGEHTFSGTLAPVNDPDDPKTIAGLP